MVKVRDTITGDILSYEDIEDFRTTIKHSFDESVHNEIDQLASAYSHGDYVGELEQYLGIEIVEG